MRSGGDVAHLEYSHSRIGPSLQLLIDHDDAVREFAYQEPNGESLAAAVRFGFAIVSMKRDWKTIFPASPSTARQRRGAGWHDGDFGCMSVESGSPLTTSEVTDAARSRRPHTPHDVSVNRA